MDQDFFFAQTKKDFNEKIKLINYIKEAGHLKDHTGCAGKIIYQNHKWLFGLVSGGATDQLQKITEIPSSKSSKEILAKYISTFFPVAVIRKTGKIKIAKQKPKVLENYSDALIGFEAFRLLREKSKDLDISDIIRIRDEVSTIQTDKDWRITLERYLRWPSTDAPASLRELLSDGWVTTGILVHFGYHVGNTGSTQTERRLSLEKILTARIELESMPFDKDYIEKWGDPNSTKRLISLAKTIAALCRNAKRSTRDYTTAISDWEEDLYFLKENFYSKIKNISDAWPTTQK